MSDERFDHNLPDLQQNQDVDSYLRSCSVALTERQAFVRSKVSGGVRRALEEADGNYSSPNVLAVLDTVANCSQEHATDTEEVSFEGKLGAEAAAVATAARNLARAHLEQRIAHANESLQDTQNGFEEAMQQNDVTRGSECMQTLQLLLSDLGAPEGAPQEQVEAASKVKQVLDNMKMAIHPSLTNALWSQYVFCQTDQLDPNQALLTVHSACIPAQLWDAAARADTLDSFLSEFATALLQFVVSPVLQLHNVSQLVVSSQDDGAGGTYSLLFAAPDTQAQLSSGEGAEGSATSSQPHAVCAPFAVLPQLVAFLDKYVFGEDQVLVCEFMEHLWPLCVHEVVSILQLSSEDHDKTQSGLASAREAEQALQAAQHLRSGGTGYCAMATGLHELESLQLQRLQGSTLLDVRHACSESVQWTDEAGSTDVKTVGLAPLPQAAGGATMSGLGWASPTVLSDGEAVVWRAACQVMDALGTAVLATAADAAPLRVTAVCQTIREAAQLYDALVVCVCQPFSSVRLALVHINSVRYLVDNISLLPLLVPLAQRDMRQQVCSASLESAAQLADVADDITDFFVRKQAAKIKKMLSELPELQQFDAQNSLTARKLVQRAVVVLRGLSESLARICPPVLHVAIISTVLGGVCEHMERKVLALSDISKNDCEEICALFEKLWSDAPSMLAVHLVKRTANSGPAKAAPGLAHLGTEAVTGMLVESCTPVQKLRALGQLLSVRMAVIVQGWEEGELQAVGFTADQVVGVLRSVFQDNDFRRQCIQRVRAHTSA